jgi:transposase InsO family protein
MGFVSTTVGISAEDVRNLMTATVEHRFGRVTGLRATIERLTDNGGCYTATEIRRFAREVNLRSGTILSKTRNPTALPKRPCASQSETTSASPKSPTPEP